MEIDKLEDFSPEDLLKHIAQEAASLEGRFCCGGSIQVKMPFTVYYQSGNQGVHANPTEWAITNISCCTDCAEQGRLPRTAGWITFPPESEKALEGLAKACHLATFGKGTTEVLDLSYRKALQLQPPNFAVSCPLVDASLIEEVSLPHLCK